jgi:hypothetical protein
LEAKAAQRRPSRVISRKRASRWNSFLTKNSPGGPTGHCIAAAFVVQYATGVVLQDRTPQAGHYPEIAYRIAFAVNLAL